MSEMSHRHIDILKVATLHGWQAEERRSLEEIQSTEDRKKPLIGCRALLIITSAAVIWGVQRSHKIFEHGRAAEASELVTGRIVGT